jgi:hypothetical protein
MVLAFGVATSFRFLALNGFSNDHFLHLAAAQQMLFGEWPTRDFADPGMPLMYGARRWRSGCWGTRCLPRPWLSRSPSRCGGSDRARGARAHVVGDLAVIAVLLEVAIVPRTYGYPKVLLYAGGFLLFLQSVRDPRTARTVAWPSVS